jgi:hypothetical protein
MRMVILCAFSTVLGVVIVPSVETLGFEACVPSGLKANEIYKLRLERRLN